MHRPMLYPWAALTTFLLGMVTMPTCSLASRGHVFKVEAEERRASLRGKSAPTRRHRKAVDQARTLLNDAFSSSWGTSDVPDNSVLGMIEKRRSRAMDSNHHVDELMLALRFSMDHGSSMSPNSVSVSLKKSVDISGVVSLKR